MKTLIISVAFALSTTSFNVEIQEASGKEIFEKNCAKCHGKDGTKKSFGVKSLQKSTLTTAENFDIISNGKGKMPSWKEALTNEQINKVVEYIETLRTNK
jgi:cytochrome c6